MCETDKTMNCNYLQTIYPFDDFEVDYYNSFIGIGNFKVDGIKLIDSFIY